MNKLQHQVTVLCTQQQQWEDKIEELHAEAERITGIIHLVHQRVKQVVEASRLVPVERLSYDLAENLQKAGEYVRREIEEILKIFQDFQGKVVPNAEVEE